MTLTQCTSGQTFTGSSKNRCQDRRVPGSEYCARHRREALARVAAAYNERVAITRSLRWRGLVGASSTWRGDW